MTNPLLLGHILNRMSHKHDHEATRFKTLSPDLGVAPDAADEMGASIAAEATAIGLDTDVDAEVAVTREERGGVSIMRGSAELDARASGEPGSSPFAFTDAVAAMFGADVVLIERTEADHELEREDGRPVASSKTTVDFVAVDFDSFDFAGGPMVRSSEGPGSVAVDTCVPEGNVAEYEVEASGAGDGVDAYTDVAVVTLEDQLSSAVVYADVLVG